MIYFLLTSLLSLYVELVRGHNINAASSALRQLLDDSTPSPTPFPTPSPTREPRLDGDPCMDPSNVKFIPQAGFLQGTGIVESWRLDWPYPYNWEQWNKTSPPDFFETTFVQNATARVRRYTAGKQKMEADHTLNFGETLQLYMHAVSPRDPVQLTECNWESVTEYFEKGGAGLRIDVESTSSFTVKDLNNTWTRTSGPINGTRSYAIVVGYTSTVVLTLPQANVIGAEFIEDDLKPGNPNMPGMYGEGGGWCITSQHEAAAQEIDERPMNGIAAYFSRAFFPDPDNDCFGFTGVFINTEGGFDSTPEPTPSPTSPPTTPSPTASDAHHRKISFIGLLATLLAVAAVF